MKLHPEEKWAWLWTRVAPHNLGFPFNISATTESSEEGELPKNRVFL